MPKKYKKTRINRDGTSDKRYGRKPEKSRPRTPSSLEKQRITSHKTRFLSAYTKLLEMGMTDQQIERIFGTSRQVRKQMSEDPDIANEYIEAMDSLEMKMAAHCVVQAIGYDYEEEKIIYEKAKKKSLNDDDSVMDEWVEVRKEKVTKHHPGSPQSFMNYMTNKFPDRWRNSREIVTRKEGYDSNPSERTRKQIVSLARDVLAANSDEPDGEYKLPSGTSRVSDDIDEDGKERLCGDVQDDSSDNLQDDVLDVSAESRY